MTHRRLTVLAGLALAASCSSRDAVDGRATAGHSSGDTTSGAATAVPWFDGALPVLLVPAHSNDRALVVTADSSAPDYEEGPLAPTASLFRLDGSSVPARVVVSEGTEGCIDAALEPAPDRPWGAGIAGGRFTAVRIDSLRAISRQDSMALAPIAFRLASTVPNTAGGRFSGLPFSLVDMWRLQRPDGVVIVATTKRQINQEDSPLEERTLIVFQIDSLQSTRGVGYSARSTGPEETVEGSDLLAAVGVEGTNQLHLIFAHDFGDQTSYSVVERKGGQWRRWWVSRRFSC